MRCGFPPVNQDGLLHSLKTNSVYAPENRPLAPKGNEKVFQPSIFSFRDCTCLGYWESPDKNFRNNNFICDVNPGSPRPNNSWLVFRMIHVDVSKNSGTPKWMVKIRENPMNNWMIWGVFPYFWKHPWVARIPDPTLSGQAVLVENGDFLGDQKLLREIQRVGWFFWCENLVLPVLE